MAAIYDIQRLRALATPSSVTAIPNLSEAAAGYAARRAETQTQEAKTAQTKALQASSLDLTADKLAEKQRQFEANLVMHKRYMDIWEEQNKWATGLGILNLGVQGLASWDQAKRVEKQDLAQQRMFELEQEKVDLTKAANREAAIANRRWAGSGGVNIWAYPPTTGST